MAKRFVTNNFGGKDENLFLENLIRLSYIGDIRTTFNLEG